MLERAQLSLPYEGDAPQTSGASRSISTQAFASEVREKRSPYPPDRRWRCPCRIIAPCTLWTGRFSHFLSDALLSVMANRMIVVPEEVYESLVSKNVLQGGLEKRLLDASNDMASALHSANGNDDDRFTRYDQRLKEVRRLLDQRNERSSSGQGQMVSLLKNIADGIQNVAAAPRTPAQQTLPPPSSPPPTVAPDPRALPAPGPRPALHAPPHVPAIEGPKRKRKALFNLDEPSPKLLRSPQVPGREAASKRKRKALFDLDERSPKLWRPSATERTASNDVDMTDGDDDRYDDDDDDAMNAPLPDARDDGMEESGTVAEWRPNTVKVDMNKVDAQRRFDELRRMILEDPERFGVTKTGRVAKPREEGDRWRGPRVYRSSLDDILSYIAGLESGELPPGTNELMLRLRDDPMAHQMLGRIASHRPTMKDLLRKHQSVDRTPRGRHKLPFQIPKLRASLYEVKDPSDGAREYDELDMETPRVTAREMVNKTLSKKVKKSSREIVRDRVRSSRLVPERWTSNRL